ncbi:phenylalanyl-tRNA synthetase subunit alpha [Anopheles sinensis]|uniref:Phenylalanyl-tRNA synthetase subunit alpha n=1 Tax=Anopheles sinensis TaxID=74873 RepID=A0A084VBH5_ANOSI|nr:phenylalanyl-tRNA synthetase subunit alpha [Anopheles sinensis]
MGKPLRSVAHGIVYDRASLRTACELRRTARLGCPETCTADLSRAAAVCIEQSENENFHSATSANGGPGVHGRPVAPQNARLRQIPTQRLAKLGD